MCRFLGWTGAPKFLDELVLEQEQSLVHQSENALIGKTTINADGFGLAWYAARETPCIYKDTQPAWSSPNLTQLASHTRSSLFLAHVRASTGMATSRNNCHPFGVGKWCFMHNGQAGGHEKFRQALDGMIPAEFYEHRYGAIESEAIFLIAMGLGLPQDPINAMARAVNMVQKLAEEKGERPYMRFAACWADGDRLVPSLFVKECKDGYIVSFEPLESDCSDWVEVGTGEAIEIGSGGDVLFHAFDAQSSAETKKPEMQVS
jgi:glutamine amidotransferase